MFMTRTKCLVLKISVSNKWQFNYNFDTKNWNNPVVFEKV